MGRRGLGGERQRGHAPPPARIGASTSRWPTSTTGSRGEASEADARFVADLAGIARPAVRPRPLAPERPAHFEADARRARYAWLAEVARRRGASVVAVGHTRDDQAETILHRILRGTGLRGLAGIPRCRPLADGVTLVRPLLDVGREELRAYLDGLGQPWREDATNADPSRTRARLRHDLLPRLAEDFNPDVAEALVRLGALARSTVAAMDEHIGDVGGAGHPARPRGRARARPRRPRRARAPPPGRGPPPGLARSRAGPRRRWTPAAGIGSPPGPPAGTRRSTSARASAARSSVGW